MDTTGPEDQTSPALIGPDEVERLRAELPNVTSCIYLNGGTVGPIPRVAAEAMQEVLTQETHDRQRAGVWEGLGTAQQQARETAARLTGADAHNVALMHATHEGLNVALQALELEPGDVLVTSSEEHPGLLVPMRVQVERRGAAIRIVSWSDDPEQWVTDMAAAIDERVRAVVISHVSWITGKVADLASIRRAIGDDVVLIVDGAQGAGVVPVSLGDDGWDAYTVSGQKWPLGPNGSGALVLREPTRWLPVRGAMFSTVDPGAPLTADWQSDGRRFEQSQEALLPLVGFAAGCGFLLDEVGVGRARAHARALARHARSRLGGFTERVRALGVATCGCCAGDGHLLCIDVRPGTAEQLASRLLEEGILIRNLGPDRLRLSFGFWNRPDEIDACVDALERADAAIS